MTFNEYIANPSGSRVMTNRQLYDTMYKEKLDKILLRENGKIDYFLFKDNPFRYIAFLKIPSEKVKNIYYDTVIEFTTKNPVNVGKDILDGYDIRVFSNDPAFMFTYAYSFIQNKMFFTDLETKMSKVARTTPASITNKNNEVGYVKTLYFAYLIMKMRGLFLKENYNVYGRKYSKTTLLQMVESSVSKLSNRQRAELDQKRDTKRFEKLEKIEPNKLATKSSKGTGKSGNVTKSKSVGRVKTIKATKKI